MNSHSPLGPKTLVASVLIAFALVGTAMAINPASVTITAPSQGTVVTTRSPAVSYDVTGSPTIDVYCGFDEPFFVTEPMSACVATGNEIPSTQLLDGSHTFVVQYVQFGVTGITATSFAVDATAPTVTITAPANGSTIVDETPKIEFSSPDGANPLCSFDGAPFSSCDTQFATLELAQGVHTLTVRVTDTYGNVGTAIVTFTIDLSAPLSDPVPPDSANVTAGKGKVAGKSLRVLVKSQILPSPDVSPKVSCTGKVQISIKPKVRKARTYKRRVSLRRSGNKCVANGTVTVPRKYKGRRAKLRMYFGGNDYMGKISVVKTIRL